MKYEGQSARAEIMASDYLFSVLRRDRDKAKQEARAMRDRGGDPKPDSRKAMQLTLEIIRLLFGGWNKEKKKSNWDLDK